MSGEVRRTIRFDADVYALIEAEMASNGVSMTGLVNKAVRNYFNTAQETDERLRALEERLRVVEQQLGIST
ncbi:hypothetical protein H6F67_14260 [Microcoleus sp. FACHB-1515]|uniref:hypothetical protein n=1 Tax=Cyanophyceae TaxID=3028117 RepID=UPI00168265BF|nr:hypothetical protein [Microcoleus sp. FACHB-1515]MBD2091015.1 hypothetical protein [Microcoleus sp. FACHB-1515]